MTCCTAPGPVEGVWREIIGVVGDVRQVNLDEDPAATVYRPYEQIVEHDMYLVLRARSDRDAGRIATELRSQMSGVDSNKAWWDVLPMWQVIRGSESIRLRRFVLILLGSFAAIALVLAAVGIYGVASTAVVVLTKEMGVRFALGATRRVVFRQMLGEMMVLAAGGVVLGSAGALALTRLIRTMLFGVSATDAATYVGVAILLGGVVLLATYVPARRAMQIDPIVALRHE
jgi:putative ABC transport system permease protein